MIKLDRDYRPEVVASNDNFRPSLTDPYFDRDAGKIVATNGYALVAVPAKNEGESSGYVAKEALTEGRKLAKKTGSTDISINGGAVNALENGAQIPTEQNRQFPPWRSVLPEYRPGSPNTVTFAFNVKYLKEVADGLGTKQVVLVVPVPKKKKGAPDQDMLDPIVVLPWAHAEKFADYDDSAIGVLMPVRTLK